MHFSIKWLKEIISALNLSNEFNNIEMKSFFIFKIDSETHLEEIASLIEELSFLGTLNYSKELSAELKVTLIKILLIIHREGKSVLGYQIKNETQKDRYVESIINYIQNNFKYDITINDISDALNLSESYVSHLFKEKTNQTIMEYVMFYRLIQARYLMEVSNRKTFKEISVECGFKSNAHFSRFVKSKTGLSPTEYREKLQKESYISPYYHKEILN